MAINKKLIHFKTREAFDNELEKGNILDTSIVFIKDTLDIWTHGSIYHCLDEGEFEEKMEEYATKNYVDNKFLDFDANGYDYVDMGEAGIWATCNIGASKPEEYGLFFAWGETKGYVDASEKQFLSNYTDYKWSGPSSTGFRNPQLTKYCNNADYGKDGTFTDNLTTLEPEDDAAHVNMGGDWRMPTIEEFDKLNDLCDYEWEEDYNGSGVAGMLLILKSDKSKKLFFPAASNCIDGRVNGLNYYSSLWSSSLSTSRPSAAFSAGYCFVLLPNQDGDRSSGLSVRAILSPSEKYLTKKDAKETYQPKGDYADKNKVGIIEDIIYNEPKPVGEAGDAVLYKDGKFYAVNPNDLEKYSPDEYTPIGVVAIPASHNVYGTGEAGVMALRSASLDTPDEGQATSVGIMWGHFNIDTELSNFDSCVSYGSSLPGSLQADAYPYLPSDQPEFSIKNPDPNSDQEVGYIRSSYAPSPYLANGTPNPDYFDTNVTSYNALSDFAGEANTELLIGLATAQKDWKTAASITNQRDAGYSPAACSCWRFHTTGTSQGDWYLPACGELGYCCVRFTKINNTLSEIARIFGISISKLDTERFWASSECSSQTARFVYFKDGRMYNNGKGMSYFVRPFCQLKLESARPENRLDRVISEVEELKNKEVDLTGYATEEYVESNYQEKGQYFDDADYNEESKEIIFYSRGEAITTVDATPFIVDNFVDNVDIDDGNLIITFNSEDRSPISIPITAIFDSDQYYTKKEITETYATIDSLSNVVGYEVDEDVITEEATSIIAVSGETLSVEPSKYYKFDNVVNTLNISLPTIGDTNRLVSSIIYFTTGNEPAITITSKSSVNYYRGYTIYPNVTYELNVMWNGSKWIVGYGIID